MSEEKEKYIEKLEKKYIQLEKDIQYIPKTTNS